MFQDFACSKDEKRISILISTTKSKDNGAIAIFDSESGFLLKEIASKVDINSKINWCGDNQRIAHTYNSKTILITNIRIGENSIIKNTNGPELIASCWCEDNERLASGSKDGSIHIWNSFTLKCILTLKKS